MSYSLNWVSDDSNEIAEFSCVHVRLRQSDEEINRMTMPESMSGVDRALLILDSGLPVQKQAVLERLEMYISQDRNLRVFSAVVVRLMQRMLPLAQESLQIAAAKSFEQLIKTFSQEANETLLELTVQILSVWSAPVHTAWLPVFSKLVQTVRKDLLNATVVRDILKLGDFNQAKTYRTAACTMTSALASHVKDAPGRQLIKKAFDLSQDIEFSIRLRMAKELEQLFQIGTAFVQGELWTAMLSLLEDDNSEVRKESHNLLLKSLKYLTSSFRREQALPLVFKTLAGPYAVEVVLSRSAEFLQVCIQDLEAIYKLRDFMDFYQAQIKSPDSEVALLATRNLPGVLMVLGAQRTEYDRLLLWIVRSKLVDCKRVVAAAIPDIAKACLDRRELVQEVIEELLDDIEVQQIILQKLPALIKLVQLDAGKIYVRLLVTVRLPKWRVQVSSLVALQMLLPEVKKNLLRETLPEILTGLMQRDALPTRIKAAEVTAVLISTMPSSSFCREVIDELIHKLAKSHNHIDRQVFLDFCLQVMHCFSRHFFKENLLQELLHFCNDPIVSVRTKLARMIPTLRMGMSTETSLVLTDLVNQLMADHDHTVSGAAGDSQAAMLLPDFWKRLDSPESLNADRLREETEAQMLVEEQKQLEEIKKQFVDQLASRAKQDYVDRKQKSKLNPRASIKVPVSPTVKPALKRASMFDIRSSSVSKPPKKK